MPNKTIYIADEDLPVFQKAQEVAGESISKVIAQALRQYIIQKNLDGTDLKECEALKGHHGYGVNVEKVRFIGKWLSEVISTTEDGVKHTYTLYHTRKSKFMLQIEIEDLTNDDAAIQYDYDVIDDFMKLYNRGLPAKLIKDAEEQLGKEHIKFLDI